MESRASIAARGTPTAPGLRLGLRSAAAGALAALLQWHEIARQRRALLTLDDRMLKDIGITRAEAEREASRPSWRDATDL